MVTETDDSSLDVIDGSTADQRGSTDSQVDEDSFLQFVFPGDPVPGFLARAQAVVMAGYVALFGITVQADSARGYVVFSLFGALVGVVALAFTAGAWFVSKYYPQSLCCSLQPKGLRRIAGGIVALTASLLSLMVHLYRLQQSDAGTCDTVVYTRTNESEYRDAWCKTSLPAMPVLLAMAMVILRIPLRAMLPATIVVSVMSIVVLLSIPMTLSSVIGTPYLIVCWWFCMFLRFEDDQADRQRYQLAQQLLEETSMLQEKCADIRQFCSRVLPPAIADRLQQQRFVFRKIDSADFAAIATISFADFGSLMDRCTPMQLIKAIDQMQFGLTLLSSSHHVQRVIAQNDEFVVVSNLIESVRPAIGVRRCCAFALKAVSPDPRIAPLRGAVHLGSLRGGFIGTEWVRYDVKGNALETCRKLCATVDARCVVISETARTVCDDADVQVEATPSERPLESVSEDPTTSLPSVENQSLNGSRSGTSMLGMSGSTTKQFLVTNVAVVDERGLHPESRHSSSIVSMESADAAGVASKPRSVLEEALRFAKDPGAAATGEDGAIDLGARYVMRTTWRFFDQFSDPQIESDFLFERMQQKSQLVWRIWLTYAAFITIHIFVLLADLRGPWADVSLVLLACCALAAVGVGVMPSRLSAKTMRQWHLPWSISALIVPLLVVFSCALATPSIVGNDVRMLVVFQALIQSTLFSEVKYQLIVKPLFLVLGFMHVLLPGGTVVVFAIFAIWVPINMLILDETRDSAERAHFVALQKVKIVHDALSREAKVRHGLLKGLLPVQIYQGLMQKEFPFKDYVRAVDATAVVLVSCFGAEDAGGNAVAMFRASSDRLAGIERALSPFQHLAIASSLGDEAIVVGPILGPPNKDASPVPSAPVVVMDSLRFASQLVNSGNYGALIECDDSVQVVRLSGVPSFNVLGVAVNRLTTIAKSVDRAALRNCLATERVVQQTGGKNGTTPIDWANAARKSWRVRGAGQIRLVAVPQEFGM